MTTPDTPGAGGPDTPPPPRPAAARSSQPAAKRRPLKVKATRRTDPADPNAMTFGEHLEDLRKRVMLSVIGLVPIAVFALFVGAPVLEFLMAPVQDALSERGLPRALMAAAPGESFGAYLWVAAGITVVLGAPWVAYQLWQFIAPGLLKTERRIAFFLLPLSCVLTASGLTLLWVYMLPLVLAFFIGFGADLGRQNPVVAPLAEGTTLAHLPVLSTDPPSPALGDCWVNTDLMQIRVCIDAGSPGGAAPRIAGAGLTAAPGIIQQYRVTEYIRLLISLSLAFIAGFQTPVVVLLLGWAGIIQPKDLTRHRRMAIMVCAVVGSVLTPSDPISLFFLAVPLYVLYELGAVLLKWFPPSRVMGRENDAGDE